MMVGVAFLAMGYFKLGSLVHYFPKHVLVGCIGGIGLFMFFSGLAESADLYWSLQWTTLKQFFTVAAVAKWICPVLAEAVLRAAALFIRSPILQPLYLLSLPFLFYGVLFAIGSDISTARANGWLYAVHDMKSPLHLFELYDFSRVQWSCIGQQTGTLIALVFFSLMHVPISM